MPKTGLTFDPSRYATVAERITLFYQRHPQGRILTELHSRSPESVVFKAIVFRELSDAQPAATGWAAEREGDGDVNLVACLENAETSAIGRALANLGFMASRERPSAEEMQKATRARSGMRGVVPPLRGVPPARSHDAPARPHLVALHEPQADPYGLSRDALQARANQQLDLLRLIERAKRHGLRAARAARWREAIQCGSPARDVMARWEERLREWTTRNE